MNRLLSSVFLGATLAFGASMTASAAPVSPPPASSSIKSNVEKSARLSSLMPEWSPPYGARPRPLWSLLPRQRTRHHSRATVAIIATGTTAAAPIGAEDLKSGTAPALRSRQSSAHSRGLLTQINEPRLGSLRR